MSQPFQTHARNTSLLTPSHGPVSDFNPRADDPCFCNSGEIFGACCGSTEAVRPPPFGVHIFENYLEPGLARELTEYADRQEGQRLMMIDNENSTPDNIVQIADERRVAERVHLGERLPEITRIVEKTFIDLADKCYGVKLDWYETPDLMRYGAGGHYMRHADSENMEMANRTWSKVIDRDLSLLIYLNDDFEGGELTFCKLNYWLRPRAGSVVMFPSGHRYLHQAETVKSGVRYAVVSWASVRGIPKVAGQPTACAIPVK